MKTVIASLTLLLLSACSHSDSGGPSIVPVLDTSSLNFTPDKTLSADEVEASRQAKRDDCGKLDSPGQKKFDGRLQGSWFKHKILYSGNKKVSNSTGTETSNVLEFSEISFTRRDTYEFIGGLGSYLNGTFDSTCTISSYGLAGCRSKQPSKSGDSNEEKCSFSEKMDDIVKTKESGTWKLPSGQNISAYREVSTNDNVQYKCGGYDGKATERSVSITSFDLPTVDGTSCDPNYIYTFSSKVDPSNNHISSSSGELVDYGLQTQPRAQ